MNDTRTPDEMIADALAERARQIRNASDATLAGMVARDKADGVTTPAEILDEIARREWHGYRVPRSHLVAALTEPRAWNVTNHYIDRTDHPCHGTTRRTVKTSNSGGFTFHPFTPGDVADHVPYRKGADVYYSSARRSFTLYGTPADLTAPFLTFTPVED